MPAATVTDMFSSHARRPFARPRTGRRAEGEPTYVAGISSPRWMGASAALLIAIGVLLCVWVILSMCVSFAGGSTVLSWFGAAAIGPVFVLLPFLVSSILVLRLTHALSERRRDGRAHGVESRSERGGALCCVIAVVAAGLIQPAAWTQEGMAGWGVVAVVFAVLSVVFQFFLGAVVTPDARGQRRADIASLRAGEVRLAALRELPLVSQRRAVLGLVAIGALLLVIAPAGFALVAVATGQSGQAGTTGGLILALGLMSFYTIVVGQAAQGIVQRGLRVAVIVAALLVGTAGWFAVTVFEAWAFFATGNPAWLAWAGAFAVFAIGSGFATLTRHSGRGGTLHVAVATLQADWMEKRNAAYADRIARLTRIIDAAQAPSRFWGALRWDRLFSAETS